MWVDGRDLVDRVHAHVASLLFLESSVKVVRHKDGVSCCGSLWKKDGFAGTAGVSLVSMAWTQRANFAADPTLPQPQSGEIS